ncbi:DUF829 domain-containing protein [Campylobacter sp. MIT 99-7217]|uniref:DUF829 domain-containing protein n=1 Tax=Campylobacter sp. MIT 99-7217 TaxID=535091 RepID=UPI00115B7F10|nr:DUF829 domain-containing protein [Campylobacter sp. MIT 99-7217]TQR34417.1 DUF829 domain-containing protein [Campylobacter sp. MIT 99-7217]
MQLKRDVFYIAGYDPRGYRYYYSLFKKNIALQNKYHSQNYTLEKAKQATYPSWQIHAPNVTTSYTFLAWNDIVRQNWPKNIFAVLQDCFDFFRIYVITGLFFRFARSCKAPLIAGFYPFFYVLFSYLFVFLIIYYSFTFIAVKTHFIVALIISFALIFLASKLILKIGNKTAAFWLSRICAFCARWSKGNIENINTRTDEFAEFIFKKLKQNSKEEKYELILVAHSVGTILASSVAAKLIALCKKTQCSYKALKILTLGECIPLMSFHKSSNEFIQGLKELSQEQDLIWFDFTSKIDGACFYLVDFIKDTHIQDSKLKLKLLSTQFHKLYTPQEYQKIRRDWYRAHFLYLCASELKGRYDFFDFIAGENFLENKINL